MRSRKLWIYFAPVDGGRCKLIPDSVWGQALPHPCSASILLATNTQFKCMTAYFSAIQVESPDCIGGIVHSDAVRLLNVFDFHPFCPLP